MPIYDYVCSACGHRFEVLRGLNEAGPGQCPLCEGPVNRAFAPPTIVFKGSGWAKVDRRYSGAPTKKAHGSGSGADAGDSRGSDSGGTGESRGSGGSDSGGAGGSDSGGSGSGSSREAAGSGDAGGSSGPGGSSGSGSREPAAAPSAGKEDRTQR